MRGELLEFRDGTWNLKFACTAGYVVVMMQDNTSRAFYLRLAQAYQLQEWLNKTLPTKE